MKLFWNSQCDNVQSAHSVKLTEQQVRTVQQLIWETVSKLAFQGDKSERTLAWREKNKYFLIIWLRGGGVEVEVLEGRIETYKTFTLSRTLILLIGISTR